MNFVHQSEARFRMTHFQHSVTSLFVKTAVPCFALLFLFMFGGCFPSAQPVSLLVPHKMQTGNLGVPTAAAMVLAYYGDDRSPETLKALAGESKDFEGTYYSDLIAGLKKIGYEWKAKGFDLDHAGFEAGMREIKDALTKARPVLISTSNPPIGKTMVIVGFNDTQKTVEVLDPTTPGSRTLTYDKLEVIWHDDFQNNDRWILLTYPLE
jgi:peptidase C39-like protein